MAKFKSGQVVRVSQIVGHGVPLPAVGVVAYLSNAPDDEWYAVRIKWVDYVNDQDICRREERERLCDVRHDWMTVETTPVENKLTLAKAFDLYCCHNDAKHNELHDLRKQGHWFRAVSVLDDHDKSSIRPGDIIMVSSGYVTNVTQGWTFDTLSDRTHGSCGSTWQIWRPNQCAWGYKIYVEIIDNPIPKFHKEQLEGNTSDKV